MSKIICTCTTSYLVKAFHTIKDSKKGLSYKSKYNKLNNFYSEVLKLLGLRKHGRMGGPGGAVGGMGPSGFEGRRGKKGMYGSMSSLPSVSSIGSRHIYKVGAHNDKFNTKVQGDPSGCALAFS